MKQEKADIILKSSSIFTAADHKAISGFVAISGRDILAVESGNGYHPYMGENTRVEELGSRTVCPGFVDTHTFFTGYVIDNLGAALDKVETEENLKEELLLYMAQHPDREVIFGNHLNDRFVRNEVVDVLLEEIGREKPIILFTKGHGTCAMNQTAVKRFGFDPDRCWSEALCKIMVIYLNDREFIDKELTDYMRMLNARGITAVKEMGFDDYYGFTDVLEDFEKQGKLTLRYHFMSQPVREGMNLDYALRMKEKYDSEYLRFSGFNQMTDGLIAEKHGDVLDPYEGTAGIRCLKNIDYEALEADVLAADSKDIRYTLHSEGDGAFRKILNIYEKCKKDDKGRLKNRHGITDLEMTHPEDRERMQRLGVFGEVYAQILELDTYENWTCSFHDVIGRKRTGEYLNYRSLIDHGVRLAAATDLPLMIPSLPESIYHGCANNCKDGSGQFNPENGMTIPEMLQAWTINGQYAVGMEQILGTLEKGKRADIAVFDTNIFEAPIEEIMHVTVEKTYVDGKLIFEK